MMDFVNGVGMTYPFFLKWKIIHSSLKPPKISIFLSETIIDATKLPHSSASLCATFAALEASEAAFWTSRGSPGPPSGDPWPMGQNPGNDWEKQGKIMGEI